MPSLPVGLIQACPDGAAITVGAPFKMQTRLNSSANSNATFRRFFCMFSIVFPVISCHFAGVW